MYRIWVMVTPLLNLYLYSYLMITCAIALELASSVVFHSPIKVLLNVISALALYSPKL